MTILHCFVVKLYRSLTVTSRIGNVKCTYVKWKDVCSLLTVGNRNTCHMPVEMCMTMTLSIILGQSEKLLSQWIGRMRLYILVKRKRLTCGLSHIAFSWFMAYLSGHVETVSVGADASSTLTGKYGAPQWSVPSRLYSFFTPSNYRTLHIHMACHRTVSRTTVRFVSKTRSSGNWRLLLPISSTNYIIGSLLTDWNSILARQSFSEPQKRGDDTWQTSRL